MAEKIPEEPKRTLIDIENYESGKDFYQGARAKLNYEQGRANAAHTFAMERCKSEAKDSESCKTGVQTAYDQETEYIQRKNRTR